MKTSDLDDIHDLRVASRRFRAVLELFHPFASNDLITELKKCVRKLTRILGGQRNIDEALLFFQSHAQTDIAAAQKICHKISELRPRELKQIGKVLMTFDHRNLDRMVRKIVAGLNEHSITDRKNLSLLAYFSDVSIRQYVPIHQLLAVSTLPEHRASRHALRIAIKKWRYFLEFIAQVLESDYTTLLEQIKEYQSILGQMNDISEFEALLSNLELPPDVCEYAEATLLAEDALLLENFTELVERKPLVYRFLI